MKSYGAYMYLSGLTLGLIVGALVVGLLASTGVLR